MWKHGNINTGDLLAFGSSHPGISLVPGFFDPGILRDIPGPGYPVDIPTTDHATEGPLFTQISGLEKKNALRKINVGETVGDFLLM